MARYVPHEQRILDAAVETLFPLPPQPEPIYVEGVLAGFARALDAIDSRLVAAGGAR